jgi:ribose 1,5-bisphosphokinase PhnN
MSRLATRLTGATSLRFDREPPDRIDAIVIVGSTCVGKTTLADAIRCSALPGVEVPQRFVTRPPRDDDNASEAAYASADQLDAAIAAGAVGVYWSRVLAGVTERYAFAVPSRGMLPVYSANNAIYVAGNVRPLDALENAIVIGVFAPDAVREARLRARSPALWRDRPHEAHARLAESADTMLSHVHVVIENHGPLESAAKQDIAALVRAVRAT